LANNRLGEVFDSLFWIACNEPSNESVIREFEPFKALYRELEKLGGGPLPTVVSTPYLALKAKLAERASKEK
jgi:hypothetical protein